MGHFTIDDKSWPRRPANLFLSIVRRRRWSQQWMGRFRRRSHGGECACRLNRQWP